MQENEKIIVVRKDGKQTIRTRRIWQYDVGHVLQFEGFELPETFQVHFALSETGDAITQIGQNGACALPDMYTQTSGMVYAWVYVADLETGLTKQAIEILVESRGAITDQVPTPVEQSAFDQAIAALNSGVARAETAAGRAETAQGAAESAEAAAKEARDAAAGSAGAAAGSAEAAGRSASAAAGSESNAAASARAAEESKSAAAGSAVAASGSAEAASGSARAAALSADAAGRSASAAAGSENNAAGSARAAALSAEAAGRSASAAAGSAEAAGRSASAAAGSESNAAASAGAAAGSAEAAGRSANAASESESNAAASARAAAGSAEAAAGTLNQAVQTITTEKNAAVTAVQQKGQEVLESIPADYSEISEAIDAAPTEETGEGLVLEEEKRTVLEDKFLDVIQGLIEGLPQDETLEEIREALVLENELIGDLYHEMAARESAA